MNFFGWAGIYILSAMIIIAVIRVLTIKTSLLDEFYDENGMIVAIGMLWPFMIILVTGYGAYLAIEFIVSKIFDSISMRLKQKKNIAEQRKAKV